MRIAGDTSEASPKELITVTYPADEERRSSLGGAPDTPLPGEDDDAFRERCGSHPETLTPRESADCAGADLAELYENEEDGGS
jgi:hypothetical protein